MIMGAALVLAALSLYVKNVHEANEAERLAANVVAELMMEIPRPEAMAPGIPGTVEADLPPEEAEADGEMAELEVDGYSYIGYLSIPSLNLELPVMSDWDYARLRVAPCLYTGSVQTDDLVIAAHNYARHFGMLTRLTSGDEVLFTGTDGMTVRYETVEVVTMEPTAIEEMTAGEYALTLFTCTYGGKSRVAVRCERAEHQ